MSRPIEHFPPHTLAIAFSLLPCILRGGGACEKSICSPQLNRTNSTCLWETQKQRIIVYLFSGRSPGVAVGVYAEAACPPYPPTGLLRAPPTLSLAVPPVAPSSVLCLLPRRPLVGGSLLCDISRKSQACGAWLVPALPSRASASRSTAELQPLTAAPQYCQLA